MGGIRKLCRMYGSILLADKNGKKVKWLWDYANEKPRRETDMTREEIGKSEKTRYEIVIQQLKEKN